MIPNLDRLVSQAEERTRSDDDEGAMSLANELVEQYPNELKVWSLRAYLHGRSRRYAEAVADLTRAIDISAKDLQGATSGTAALRAIDLFFNRGADRFALGDDQSAIEDFSKGLDLCDHYRTDDYRETLHFWRAEALLRAGKKRDALSDLARVRDDFSFWTFKLRTKADLLADCEKLPEED